MIEVSMTVSSSPSLDRVWISKTDLYTTSGAGLPAPRRRADDGMFSKSLQLLLLL